jgi:uncharacterized SAM-binding protein YcdF (DUF218 family)
LIAGVCVAMGLLVFWGVGRWLVVEDPLEKAPAIVVLSGAMPLRAIEAAKLFREGYAPEVWLTSSAEPGETLRAMDIPFVGEDSYNSRILVHEGVPENAIHVIPRPIENTADEVSVILAELVRKKNQTVIIVTTKAHTRRTRMLWQRLSGGRGRAIIRAATEDPFDPVHWWGNTTDALDVVREVLGVLNVWAGLPLRPAP